MSLAEGKIGKIRTQVGTIKGKRLRFLGQVRDCDKDECPIKEMCSFKPKGRCTVIYNFLSSLYHDWVDPEFGLGDVLSQVQLDRIGLHLIPLYHIHIRLLLETYALKKMTYTNKQGGEAVYPQFREILNVLNQVRAELKDIGIEDMWVRKFGENKALPAGKSIDTLIRDGQGYEAAQGIGHEASEEEEAS